MSAVWQDPPQEERDDSAHDLTRRDFVAVTAITAASLSAGLLDAATPGPGTSAYSLIINGSKHDLHTEPRVTLLDLLRERLHLTGTKKGCDHGQCGACTVLADGVRINSCLTLAIAQQGKQITTIEGLATGENLHPLQAAFIERDAFQCGFCTSGQICSAAGMLREFQAGTPSAVTEPGRQAEFSDAEIRERMAGNICRCGAYPNIVAAIRDVRHA